MASHALVDDRTLVVGRISGVYGVGGWVKVFSETEPRDAILAYSEKLSAGAQKSLEAGQTGAAAKSVLEILIMIVTPVEAHGV